MIETERLILRPPTLDDFEPMARMGLDPSVYRFIGRAPATREETWHRLLRFAGHWPLFGYGLFSVVEKGGGFLGYVGLARYERGIGSDFDADPEAGWVLAGEAQGRGIGAEAARAAHDWFDERFSPPRTVCIIDPGNAPSLRLAERLGYAPYREAIYKESRVAVLERRREASLRRGVEAP
jgi:RimJ/RimL family protein N-acetyltransferase